MELPNDLTNSALKAELSNEKSLLSLENILSDEVNELNKLHKRNNRSSEERIPEEELKKQFNQVVTDVNNFLGVENNQPDVKYKECADLKLESAVTFFGNAYLSASVPLAAYAAATSHYAYALGFLAAGGVASCFAGMANSIAKETQIKPGENQILLNSSEKTSLIPEAAHGYTAFLQKNLGMPGESICWEGSARGVQKTIAKQYAEEENNPDYMRNVFETSVPELLSAYMGLCQEMNKNPKQSLLKDARTSIIPKLDNNYRNRHKKGPKISDHALGNAWASVKAANNGEPQEMYRKLFQGTKYN